MNQALALIAPALTNRWFVPDPLTGLAYGRRCSRATLLVRNSPDAPTMATVWAEACLDIAGADLHKHACLRDSPMVHPVTHSTAVESTAQQSTQNQHLLQHLQ